MAAILVAKTSSGDAATLAITPDKNVYAVGDIITLRTEGDAMGRPAAALRGAIVFDGGLAEYVSSEQETLQDFSPGTLSGGGGFANAFSHFQVNAVDVNQHVVATVTLVATAPGTLEYGWSRSGLNELRFVQISESESPGGSVTIVPEPATGALVGLGVIGLVAWRLSGENRRSSRHAQLYGRSAW